MDLHEPDAGTGGDAGAVTWPLATMSREQTISITATDDEGPASGVTATLRRRVSADQAPLRLWQGQSDETGALTGAVVLTPDDAELELILTRPGYEGPYSNPSFRAAYGAYAPAAWLYLTPSELGSLDVQLERTAQ